MGHAASACHGHGATQHGGPTAALHPLLSAAGCPSTPDGGLRLLHDDAQEGLNAANVEAEEEVWTRLIAKYETIDRPWQPDVVRAGGLAGGRAEGAQQPACLPPMPTPRAPGRSSLAGGGRPHAHSKLPAP